MLCQNTLFRFFSLIRRTDSFLILIDTARIISCLLYTSSSPSSGGISGANSSEAEEPHHCHVLGVTPPRRGLQDTDTATGSRNLLLELTSCQGKGSSEPQGLRSSWADWSPANPRNDGAGAGPAQGASTPRAPLGTCGHCGQDHNQNKPFLAQTCASTSSTQGWKHLIYPDLSQSQTQPHNLISGVPPTLVEAGEENLPLGF